MTRNKLWLLLLFVAVLSALALTNRLGGWIDDADYVVLARALATGQGYSDIYLPDSPPHTARAPFFPVLLSPIVYLFGYNVLALKALVAGFALASVYLTYRLLRGIAGERQAFLIAALVGIAPEVVLWATQVMADLPYLALVLASLLAIKKYGEAKRPLSWWLLFALLFSGLSFSTRQIGLSLLVMAAYLYFETGRGKLGLTKAGLFAAGFLLPAFAWLYRGWELVQRVGVTSDLTVYAPLSIWSHWGIAEGGWSTPFRMWANNFISYPAANIPKVLIPGYDWPFRLLPTLAPAQTIFGLSLSAFLVGGFIYCLLKRRTVIEYCFVGYVAIILLFIVPAQRYLVPILPFLLYYFITGLRGALHLAAARVSGFRGRATPVYSLVIALMLFTSLASDGNLIYQARKADAYVPGVSASANEKWRQYHQLSLWLKENTSQDSILMGSLPAPLYVWSGRKVVMYPGNPEEVLDAIARHNINYVVIDSFNRWAAPTQKLLRSAIEDNPAGFLKVYQQEDSLIYEVRR